TATKYGRQVVAVGSNAEAARRVGMPAKWIIASVYIISGIACAVAVLLIAARLGIGADSHDLPAVFRRGDDDIAENGDDDGNDRRDREAEDFAPAEREE
ncbi:hypothetical protein ACC862_37050, partial [Rhizobium ruizarguesonis]